MGAAIPSGIVTFVFTDIEGSTRRWQADPAAMADAVVQHDAIIRASVDQHHGHVFATGGDGFAIAFQSPHDAVKAATEIQAAIEVADWPTAESLQIRIGAHLGTASERNDDYFGPPVNLAARIEAAGHGGQILVSDEVASQIDVEGTDLGEHRLKDIEHPVRIWQLDEGTHPRLRTIEATPNTLPILRTETIGREETLDDLRTSLSMSRLVTVVGPGGCGKTRLAVEVGAAELPNRRGGAFFADLTTIDGGAAQVWTALQTGIGLAPEGTSQERVVTFLDGRGALLIVDNCEQVIDEAAEVVEHLLDACTELSVVATSREALDVAGERVVRIPSLDVAASSRLFVSRAIEAGAALGADDDDHIESICTELDGIPLAIELAAARAKTMSVAEIAGRLDDRLALLSAGRRRSRRRQQTLSGVLDWSYGLLDDVEQQMLRGLAVFVGGFDLADVAPVTGFDDPFALELVDSLVGKSLVDVVRLDDGTLDRRLLETVRLYGLDKLLAEGESEERIRAHRHHFSQPRLALSVARNLQDPEIRAREIRRWANFEQVIESYNTDGERGIAAALVARCVTGVLHVGGFSQYRELLLEQLDQAPADLQPSICAAATPAIAFGDFELAGLLAARAAELRETDPDNEDLIFACTVTAWMRALLDLEGAVAISDDLLEAAHEHSASPIVRQAILTVRCAMLITLGRLDEAWESAWQGADGRTVSGMVNSVHGTWCDIMRGSEQVRRLANPEYHSYGSFDYLAPMRDIVATIPSSSPAAAGHELAALASELVDGLIPSQDGDYVVAFAWLRWLDGQQERAIELVSDCAPRMLMAEADHLLHRGVDAEDHAGLIAAFRSDLPDPERRSRRRAFNRQALADEIEYWS